MRQLNGVYSQYFNRCHRRVGHVFQGRYKAILVQKESYLLELSRYIVLNPVRAGMVKVAGDWPWSSYQSTTGQVEHPLWLDIDWILAAFEAGRHKAMDKYRDFVSEGADKTPPWENLKNQIYLGDESFVDDMQCKMAVDASLDEVPSGQKRPVTKPLDCYLSSFESRDQAIYSAYQRGSHTMKEIGDYYGLHYSSVSKIVKHYKNSQFKT